MPDCTNVQISSKLFNSIVSLIDFLYFSNFVCPKLFSINAIRSELQQKQHKINMRNAYSKIVYSKDDEQRLIARKYYMCLNAKNDFA